ncbi:MAG: SoxR reducing system RseC family protein [Clostridia bacterium]|nr:SoxR reducing system RseC family protein [Clostridia bacterium]
MKKYGEITAIYNHTATVRIYKIKRNEEAVSTAKTLTASLATEASVGDMAEIEVNRALLFLSTVIGYLFPVFTGVFVHGVAAMLTDNLIIMQSLFMLALMITYIFASHISKKTFFKNLPICTVTKIVEIE